MTKSFPKMLVTKEGNKKMDKQKRRHIEALLVPINLFSKKYPPESFADPSVYDIAMATLHQAVIYMDPSFAEWEEMQGGVKEENKALEFEQLISMLFELCSTEADDYYQEVYKILEEATSQVFAMVPSETADNLIKTSNALCEKFKQVKGDILMELRFFAEEHLPKDEVTINCYDAAIAVLEKAMIYINPPSADPENRSYYSDSADKYWELIFLLSEIDELLAMDLGDLDEGYKISLDYEPFQVGELLEEAKWQLFTINLRFITPTLSLKLK